MIQLTRLNHVPLIVNADLIEHVEVTPDTVVALTNGQKFMVLETAEEVVEKVIQFRKALISSVHCPLKIEDRTADDHPEQPASGAKTVGLWGK
jgi:flagellar protein FlbD